MVPNVLHTSCYIIGKPVFSFLFIAFYLLGTTTVVGGLHVQFHHHSTTAATQRPKDENIFLLGLCSNRRFFQFALKCLYLRYLSVPPKYESNKRK